MVLEACKKEYQRLQAEHKTFLKIYVEQQEELPRYKKYFNKNPPVVERKKIKLSNIEFDEEKIKKLLSRQVRKKRPRYYYNDDNSDAADNEDDVQSDDDNNDGECSDDEETAATKKEKQKR